MKEQGVAAFDNDWFGQESEDIQAELEVVGKEGDTTSVKSRQAQTPRSRDSFASSDNGAIGSSPKEAPIKNCTRTWQVLSAIRRK